MCRHTYNLSIRFNYINSMLARMNRSVGDAAEMTRVLDEPRLVEDGTHAELSQAGGTYESLWDRQTGAFLEAE